MKAITTSTTNISICPAQLPFSCNGNQYNSTGSYNKRLINAAGCDSIAALVLSIKATTSGTINHTACTKELPYTSNGIDYNSAGTYYATFINAAGCDSVATLVLVINESHMVYPAMIPALPG